MEIELTGLDFFSSGKLTTLKGISCLKRVRFGLVENSETTCVSIGSTEELPSSITLSQNAKCAKEFQKVKELMYSQNYLQSMSITLEKTQASIGSESADLQAALDRSLEILKSVQSSKGTQFFLGNGASAAFADHMALDWTKNGGIRSMNPSSAVLLTALANDISYQDSFATFLDRYARSGDLVVTISSSGNSENVIRAITAARKIGCQVITLSGLKPDNSSRKMGDVNFYVPAHTYGIVECAHQVLLHMLIDAFMGIREWERSEYQNMNVSQFRL